MNALVHLVRRRIAAKLTVTLVAFVAVTLLVAAVYLNRELEALAVGALEARLATAAEFLLDDARRLLAVPPSPDELYAFARRGAAPSGARVTLIRRDGIVIADSEVPPRELGRLENHAGRPEVRAALTGGEGHDLRRSVSIDRPLLYVAVPVREGGAVLGVLRLALPLAVVTESYGALHRAVVAGGLVALAVALGLGLVIARRITSPLAQMEGIARRMSEGDFTARVPVRSPDELGELGRALNVMAAHLRQEMDEVAEERRKVAAILDGMIEGVLAVDGRDDVIVVNERARAMCELGAADVQGKPFLEVVRSAELHALLREVRATGGPVLGREVSIPAGRRRVIQVNAVPLALGHEEAGVVMVLSDVTELRRLERVRTEFVANVSHELRTPLTAIQGYLETLLGENLTALGERREFLEIAARHTERLGRLLGDLTDLSNIELGRIRLELEGVDVGGAVARVFELIAPKARQGGVTLHAETPAALPAVHADRDRLEQILINLVDNAVKYTPAEGHVTVSARAIDAGTLEIAVADTGIGIPPADLPRVTERFYRVDKARSRELGGTGLGLAIVKHLVLAHHGELRLESAPGRGTTVRFTIPTFRAEAAP